MRKQKTKEKTSRKPCETSKGLRKELGGCNLEWKERWYSRAEEQPVGHTVNYRQLGGWDTLCWRALTEGTNM